MIPDPDILQAASPYNMAHVLLPGSIDAAPETLDKWQREGVLVKDAEPRFYRYTIEHDDGVVRGIVGLFDVLPFGDRVLGHEETMPQVGTDRRDLLQATRANLDLIILLSPAPELPSLLDTDGEVRSSFIDDRGERHTLSDLDLDPGLVAAAIGSHPVAIADGHHRYGAARRLLEETGDPAASSILAFVAPAEGSGFDVEPIHRFAPSVQPADLEQAFIVTPTAPHVPVDPGAIVLVTAGASLLLRPRPERVASDVPALAVASTHIARRLLYPLLGIEEAEVEFLPDPDEVVRRAVASRRGAGLLMAAVPDWAIADAAEAGLRFPHKTTLFVPKPRAGLVIYRHATDPE